MLTNNAQEFRNFLISQGINLEFKEGNDGNVLVEIRESLECGAKLRIGVVFDKEDSMVSIYGLEFIQGVNPSKKSYMYESINDLNSTYTYYKFILNRDVVEIQAFALFNDNFNSEVLMRYIMGMMNVANSEFSNLMRVIWS